MAKRLFAGGWIKPAAEISCNQPGCPFRENLSNVQLLNSDAACWGVCVCAEDSACQINPFEIQNQFVQLCRTHTFILRMGSILVLYDSTENDQTFCKCMLLHNTAKKGLMGRNTWILCKLSQQQEGQTFWYKPSVFLVFLWAEHVMSVLRWTSVQRH